MYVMLDDEVGDATIYLTEAEPSSTTVSCPVECPELKGELIIDVNPQGQLISIEVLGAWTALTPDVLAAAQRYGIRPEQKVVRHGSRHRRGKSR